jgi:hypothetical protein
VDPRNIENKPQSVQQWIQHGNMVCKELYLSGPEQQLFLHEILIAEYRCSLLKGLCEAKTRGEAMILLEKAVPCLLHPENRVSECIIQMLFLKAFSYVEEDNHVQLWNIFCPWNDISMKQS